MTDPLVAALANLIKREGGRAAVADAIGSSEQTLYQIVSKVKDSKTGKPKSVGPSLRKRLDEKYPNWLSLSAGTQTKSENKVSIDLDGDDATFMKAYWDLPDQERRELYAHVLASATRYREYAERYLRERHGVTGTASADRVAAHIDPAPTVKEEEATYHVNSPQDHGK